MTFLQNAWYMIAWSDEVPADGTLFPRTVLNNPVMLYRTPDSIVHGLLDRCPHRFAPLSLGKLIGENIQCGYHGLEFDTQGQCVRNPFNNAKPSAAKVRVFPLAEVHGTIWIWPGDADAADPALLPDIPHHHDPAFRYVKGLTIAKADYRLLSDNLMDLGHTAFLHPSFGGLGYIPKFKSWEEPDGSIVSDYVIDEIYNFVGEEVLPGKLLRHNDCIRWIAPSVHILDSRTNPVGDPDTVMYVPSAHILTPETDKTTLYFWSSALEVDSPMPDEDMLEVLRFAFDQEDKPMVEAVQRRMGDEEFWDLDPILLPNDAGSVRMRRKLKSLIDAEQEKSAAPAPQPATVKA